MLDNLIIICISLEQKLYLYKNYINVKSCIIKEKFVL